MAISAWTVGLFFSIVIGGFVTWLFLTVLRRQLGVSSKPRLSCEAKGVPGWLTGTVERLFFTVLVGSKMSGTPTAMIGWLALKLATNWNHPDWKEKPYVRTFALSALLAGLVSMLFALIGGMVCAGTISLGI